MPACTMKTYTFSLEDAIEIPNSKMFPKDFNLEIIIRAKSPVYIKKYGSSISISFKFNSNSRINYLSYSCMSLIADIGGFAGMLLGTSIITLYDKLHYVIHQLLPYRKMKVSPFKMS